MVSSFLTRGFLIGESAPEALSVLLTATAGDYFAAEARVGLVRGDIVDAGVVVLVVIPVKISFEVSARHSVVQKLAWVFRGALGGRERGLNEGIVVGRSRPSEQLGHMVILTELANRFGFHLPAAVVDQFGSPVFRQVEDIFLF